MNKRQVNDVLREKLLGHPLHPMITDVPVGAWTVTAVLDDCEKVMPMAPLGEMSASGKYVSTPLPGLMSPCWNSVGVVVLLTLNSYQRATDWVPPLMPTEWAETR